MSKGSNKDSFQNDIEEIKSSVADATQHAKDRASKAIYDSFDNLKDRSSDIQDTLIAHAKKEPVKTLGIAFLAGLAIGLLILR